MSAGASPAQAGVSQADIGNTSIRESGAASRGTVIGGDASAKTSMGGGGSGGGSGGGGGGGGGGGSGGGGYSLGASIAGSQTVASGQSGDVSAGNSGFLNLSRSKTAPIITVATGGSKASSAAGLPAWALWAGGAVVVLLAGLAFMAMRHKGA